MTGTQEVVRMLREQADQSRAKGRPASADRMEAKADEYELHGRVANCRECPNTKPSSYSLAIFAYRGDGSSFAVGTCRCGFRQDAHQGEVHPMRQTVNTSDPAGCSGFESMAAESDLYYCGCEGWD